MVPAILVSFSPWLLIHSKPWIPASVFSCWGQSDAEADVTLHQTQVHWKFPLLCLKFIFLNLRKTLIHLFQFSTTITCWLCQASCVSPSSQNFLPVTLFPLILRRWGHREANVTPSVTCLQSSTLKKKNVISLCYAALTTLVSWLRIEPVALVMGAWSLSPWTSREVPQFTFFLCSCGYIFARNLELGGDPFLCVHSWCCRCQWDPFHSYAAHCHQGFHPLKKKILFHIYFRTCTQSHCFLYQLYLLSQLHQFACPPTICERASCCSQQYCTRLFRLL